MLKTKPHYVNYEVASLLLEKGFDELCFHFYDSNRRMHKLSKSVLQFGITNSYFIKNVYNCIAAPNIDDVKNWLYKYHYRTVFDISSHSLGKNNILWKLIVLGAYGEAIGWCWFNCVKTYTDAFNESVKYFFNEIMKKQ